MARPGVSKTNLVLLRGAKTVGRCMSKLAARDLKLQEDDKSSRGSKKQDHDSSSCWMPHPRTGIYFPKGHQWIMEDVPEGAASFGQITYWLRNIDGVDKPEPDTPSDLHKSLIDKKQCSDGLYEKEVVN